MSKQDNMEAPHFPGGPDADSRSLEEVGSPVESGADGEFREEPAGPTMSESSMTPEATIRNERGTDRENAGGGRVMVDEEGTSTAGHLDLFGVTFPQRGQNTRTFQGQVQATGIASGNNNVLKTKANPIEPSPPPPAHDAEEGQELDTLNEIPRVEVARTLLPMEVPFTQQNARVQKELALDLANSEVHSIPKATYDTSDAPVPRKPEVSGTSGIEVPLRPEENHSDERSKVVGVPNVVQREPYKENEVNLGDDRATRANHEAQGQGLVAHAGTANRLESRRASAAIDEATSDTSEALVSRKPEEPGTSGIEVPLNPEENHSVKRSKVAVVPNVVEREPYKENEVNLGDGRATRANHEPHGEGFETLAGTANRLESRRASAAIDEAPHEQPNFNTGEQEHPRAQNGLLDSFDPQNNVLQDDERCEASHEDTYPKTVNANRMSTLSVQRTQDESEVNLRDIRATLPHVDKQQPQVDTQQDFSNRSGKVIEVESPTLRDGLADPSSKRIEDQGERNGDDDHISNQQHSEAQIFEINDGQDDRNDDSNDVSGEVDMPGSHQSPEENAEFANDDEDARPEVEHSMTPPNEVDGQPSGNAKHDNDVAHAAPAAQQSVTSSNERPQIDELALELHAETLRRDPDIAYFEGNLYALFHINLLDLHRYFYDDQRNSIPPALREIQRRIFLFTPDEKDMKQSDSLMPRHSQVGSLLSHSGGPPSYQVPVPIWGRKAVEKRITNPTDDCNAFHFPVPAKEVPDQLNGSNNDNLANAHDGGQLRPIFQLRRNVPPGGDVLPQIPVHVFPAQLNVQHQQEVNGAPVPEDIIGRNLAGMRPVNDRVEIYPDMPPEVCLRCRAALGYAEHHCPADAVRDDVHAVGDANQQPENPEDGRAFNDANP